MNQKKYVYTIGIILLAVALVTIGLSYAYFTASVGGSGNQNTNTTNVTAVSLGSIKYEGALTFQGQGLYPGYQNIQTFTIEKDSQSGNGIYEIDIEANVPSEFGTDVEITLYKTTNPTLNNIIRQEGTLVKEGENYYKKDIINLIGTLEKVYGPIHLVNNQKIILEQQEFNTNNLDKTTYYLVYNYKDNENQNQQQGLSFQGKVSVRYITNILSKVLSECKDTAAECFLKNSDVDKENLIYDSTTDNNLRYIGVNPNNYVNFNNELWRIIGVMKNVEDSNGDTSPKLKLIRNESIGKYSWDSSDTIINLGSGVNEWSQSDLKELLNDFYYNAKSNQTCYEGANNKFVPCDFSETGLKDDISKSMIIPVKWKTGTNGQNGYTSVNNGLASQFL